MFHQARPVVTLARQRWLAVTMLCASVPVSAQEVRYHAHFLTFGESQEVITGVVDLNDAGQLLFGIQYDPYIPDGAYLWDRELGFIPIPDSSGAPGTRGGLLGMNDLGQVVAVDNICGSYIWEPEAPPFCIPLPPGHLAAGYGINNHMEVVGWGGSGMMYWSAETGLVPILDLPGGCTCARLNEINDAGTATGRVTGFSGRSAVIWTLENGLTLIRDDSSGVYAEEGRAINELGQVTGYGGAIAVGEDGFFWDPQTGFRSLGLLGPSKSLRWNEPEDINDAGQVVGLAVTDWDNYEGTAFIWDREQGIRDLNLLVDEWTRQNWFMPFGTPYAINNLGAIGIQNGVEIAVLHPFILADMDCDGAVTFFDVDGFVTALFDLPAFAAAYPDCRHEGWAADMNQDARVDFFDVDAFLGCLIGGVCP